MISSTSIASAEYLFPLPQGKHKVTSGYESHKTRLKTNHKSLDFQVAEIPTDVTTPETMARCYSYGAPILASKDGTVIEVDDTVKGKKSNSYGNFVRIKHEDDSIALYGHMIMGTLSKYVSIDDKVTGGQILGLMGDTGTVISGQTPCERDSNVGTHLHFESRNLFNDKGQIITPEPLGGHSNIKENQVLLSSTIPYDPKGAYVKNHLKMKYPYVLKLSEVKSLTPLQAEAGKTQTFSLTGRKFFEEVPLLLSKELCETQNYRYISSAKAEIECAVTTATGKKKGGFSNPKQPEGTLSYEIDVQTGKPSGTPRIDQVARPQFTNAGDWYDMTITGQNLPGTLDVLVEDQAIKWAYATCKNNDGFSFLSSTKIQTRCRMPLNVGPLKQEQDRTFLITIYKTTSSKKNNESPLYTDDFSVNYHVSTGVLTPLKAVYGVPTRFTITGKNVHRLTAFFLEGCADWKAVSRDYDKLVVECPNIVRIEGKTKHLMLVKTQKQTNPDGTKLSDEEDRKNTLISTYIQMSDDPVVRIDSIEPSTVIVGKLTTFTVTGNRLPFTNEKDKQPQIWIADCVGKAGVDHLDIISDTYTPYGFQFTCTPQFSDKELSANVPVEKAMKIKVKTGTPVQAEKTVTFITESYESLQEEKEFFDLYPRKEGPFTINGPAKVTKSEPRRINDQKRHEIVVITGTSLPRTLELVSDDCEQVAVKYASSERYEFVCLIEKVPTFAYEIIDTKTNDVVTKKSHRVIEIYSIDAVQKGLPGIPVDITINGVNLDSNLLVSGNECEKLTLKTKSPSQLTYDCSLVGSASSPPEAIQILITESSATYVFFDGLVIIDREIGPFQKTSQATPTPKPFLTGGYELDMKILSLSCDGKAESSMLMGSCSTSSPFIRSGNGIAAINTGSKSGLVYATFDAGLGKKLDNAFGSANISLNPLSGEGLVAFSGGDASLLLNGDVKGLGFNADKLAGFPLNFDLVDFSGELLLSFPNFDMKRSRSASKVIIGLGDVQSNQLKGLESIQADIEGFLNGQISKANASLDKAKIQIGNDLVKSIKNKQLKKLTKETYIQMLKVLELVPEAVAIYDNFDISAKGRLKSEPFRPKNWPENKNWFAEANIASLDIDLSAKDHKMLIKGQALKELSLFNNDFIKAEDGLLNAGITLDLKTDNGRIDLNPLTIRLPFEIAKIEADAYVRQVFNPAEIGVLGRIKSGIIVKGLELAKAGAAFQLDPNVSYKVGDYETLGLMRIDGNLYMVGLNLKGSSVFTMPGNQLAMDLGGTVDLEFMGLKKQLGDALSRSRIGETITTCINSESGTVTLSLPTWSGWEEVTLQGQLSLEGEAKMNGVRPIPQLLAMSAGAKPNERLGVKVDMTKNWWNPTSYSKFTQKCKDAPGREFFDTMLVNESSEQKNVAQTITPLLASVEDSFLMAQATNMSDMPAPTWDMTGWIIIAVQDLNGNKMVVKDKAGKEVVLGKNPFVVDGMWFFDNPDQYVIFDQAAFNAAGYSISIQQLTEEGTDFVVATYTNTEQTDNSFQLPRLQFNENPIELQSIVANKEISIKDKVFKPASTVTKPITEADRKVESTVTSKAPSVAASEKKQPPPDFPDVPSDHRHYEAIMQLASEGVINGFPDGSFKPDQKVNRAEFVKMVLTAFDYELIEKKTPSFKDSSPSDWHYPYIETARFHEMIKGYTNRFVKPAQSIIKAEGLKIVLSSLSLRAERSNLSGLPFTDVPSSEWFAPYVQTALDAGVDLNLIGNNPNRFEPSHEMTRGEVAELIVQVMKSR